jgi:hypothetical protein
MQRVIMKSELHSATVTQASDFQHSCHRARMYERELRDCTSMARHVDAQNHVIEQAAIA